MKLVFQLQSRIRKPKLCDPHATVCPTSCYWICQNVETRPDHEETNDQLYHLRQQCCNHPTWKHSPTYKSHPVLSCQVALVLAVCWRRKLSFVQSRQGFHSRSDCGSFHQRAPTRSICSSSEEVHGLVISLDLRLRGCVTMRDSSKSKHTLWWPLHCGLRSPMQQYFV